jgi:prepilin-type N-terminal cleavage/methylation domain-containing protein
MNNRSLQGFTLSELLVSLAVLGLIAAFAIPKVLTAVGESSARAIGREAFGMISESYQALRANQNGNVSRATDAQDLIDQMNYASTAATGNGTGTSNHVALQNGAVIAYAPGDDFDTANARGVIGFTIDPDGLAATSVSGPVSVYLGSDGRIWAGDEAYTAGTGSTESPFNTTYGVGTTATPVELIAPNNEGNNNSSTTWFS